MDKLKRRVIEISRTEKRITNSNVAEEAIRLINGQKNTIAKLEKDLNTAKNVPLSVQATKKKQSSQTVTRGQARKVDAISKKKTQLETDEDEPRD